MSVPEQSVCSVPTELRKAQRCEPEASIMLRPSSASLFFPLEASRQGDVGCGWDGTEGSHHLLRAQNKEKGRKHLWLMNVWIHNFK